MIHCRHIAFAAFLLVSVILKAETVVYSVTSYHDIALSSGEAPNGSSVTFNSTTGRGAQITAGNSATLTITGYDAQAIQSVSLQMHSNKSSGAGSLTATLDGTVVATIADASFADAAWNGSFVGSDSWADVVVPFGSTFTFPAGGVLSIVVTASVNSLYVGGCTINYVPNSDRPYPKTVFFSTGTEEELAPIRETSAGKGVRLPSLGDADSVWHFLGWIEGPLPHSEVCPTFFKAGMQYYPSSIIQLHALYTNKLHVDSLIQDTLFETGEYAVVAASEYHKFMMEGSVEDRKVSSSSAVAERRADGLYALPMETIPEENRYRIVFTDSMATIQHVATNSFVGFNSTASTSYLRNSRSEWQVMQCASHSLCFYHNMNIAGEAFCIFPRDDHGEKYFADTKLILSPLQQFLLLFRIPENEPVPALYTTTPRSGVGLSETEAETVFRVFRIDGSYVLSGGEQQVRSLPRGMYIIHSARGTQKRLVQ